jgi:hypothetical protein
LGLASATIAQAHIPREHALDLIRECMPVL